MTEYLANIILLFFDFDVAALLLTKVAALVVGDPADAATVVGPKVSLSELVKVEQLVAEATAAGATVLCGGKRKVRVSNFHFFSPFCACLTRRLSNLHPNTPTPPPTPASFRLFSRVATSQTTGLSARCAGGFFYEPTVVTDVAADSPLIRSEVFGPVLPLQTFADFDEAMAMANDS